MEEAILLSEERVFWELFKSKEFGMAGYNPMYRNDIMEILLVPLYSDGEAIKINGFVVKINNRWQYDVIRSSYHQ
jgi:hypothetical protein